MQPNGGEHVSEVQKEQFVKLLSRFMRYRRLDMLTMLEVTNRLCV